MKALMFTLAILLAPAAAIGDARSLASFDRQVTLTFPDLTYRIATSIGRPDESGLIGRNREWGGFFSVRFQYGAGRALRHGWATQDAALAESARAAIRAGLSRIEQDGSFPASLPRTLFPDVQLGPSDQASAAAFFLSDVCPALMIVGPTRSEIEQIRSAMAWLGTRQSILLNKDRAAPNRLLIDALAYGSCGALLNDESIQGLAEPFLREALSMVQPDGVFLEAGGSDSSYQSVALVVAFEILALNIAPQHQQELRGALQIGSDWLHSQVGPDGALDSSLNTRTCVSETFLGRAKDVDLREVFRALSYSGAILELDDDATERFSSWLSTEPDPCGSLEN